MTRTTHACVTHDLATRGRENYFSAGLAQDEHKEATNLKCTACSSAHITAKLSGNTHHMFRVSVKASGHTSTSGTKKSSSLSNMRKPTADYSPKSNITTRP